MGVPHLSFSLKELKNTFLKLTDALNDILVPFSLLSLQESEYICEGEERDWFEDSFSKYIEYYKQVLRLCKTFLTCRKPVKESTKNKSFIRTLDTSISIVIDNFENIVSEKDPEKFKEIKRAKQAYYAFLQLVRALNTCILQYNKMFPEFKLETLKNIPEPKVFKEVKDLSRFFKDTIKVLKTLSD